MTTAGVESGGVESGARTHTSAVTDNAASAGAAPSQNRGARDTGPAAGGLQDQGVHRDGGQRDQPRYTSSDVDYEKKYAPDAYGKELSKNARVWSVYNDEAQIADEAMVKELNGTLDVLLVFAGLFSAVVTTFVAQSSQALNPDYAQITASLVYELVLMQRAARAGTSGVPASSLNPASRTSQTTDLWVHGLWLVSLMTALLTALVSVLAKQWIQHYNSLSGGAPRDRAHLRQFRLQGFQRWRVQEIIGFLPVLLTVALLLFFAGLVVYVAPMNAIISWVIIGFSCAILLSYALAALLPVFIPHCAYKTPLAHYILVLQTAVSRLCQQLTFPLVFVYRRMHIRFTSYTSWTYPLFSPETPKTLRHRESYAVQCASDVLTGDALTWLVDFPRNTSAVTISLQAASALHVKSDSYYLALASIHALYHNQVAYPVFAREHAALAERLARIAMHHDTLYLFYYPVCSLDIWEQLYTHRHHLESPSVKAILCVVCWVRFCDNAQALAHASTLSRAFDAVSLLDICRTEPKLHPVVWREMNRMVNACLLLCDSSLDASVYLRAYDLHEDVKKAEQHAQYAHPGNTEDRYEDTAVTLDEYCEGCRWEGGRKKFLDDLEKLKCALSERLEKLKN
ncbi:hypothetical protein EV714DRAFT_203591, partial [Schizophyllum commune]